MTEHWPVETAPSAPEVLELDPQASPAGDAGQEAELERIVSSQAVSTHYILFIRGLDP